MSLHPDETSDDVTLPRDVALLLLEAANRQVSLEKTVKTAGEVTLRFTPEASPPDFNWAAITATAIIKGP